MATLSRKHFREFAEMLAHEKPCTLAEWQTADPNTQGRYDAWMSCVYAVARVLRESNPRFDDHKFKAAAGIDNVP
jgi:hypothetical protein